MQGSVTRDAFEPDPKTVRADNGHETSVNWEDNEDVLRLTLLQKSTAAHGAARFAVDAVDAVAALPNVRGRVFAERREVDGNPHHGNLVFDGQLPATTRKAIAQWLALASELIPPPSS